MDEHTRQKRRAMANGMSSLYVGTSGLQSAQTALNTTAHNLANINTTGYTRQQILFTDNSYLSVSTLSGNQKVGLGVAVADINRVRNEFIDAAYRSENSRLGYYESQYNAVEEVEDLFGELQGVTYQSYMTDLYNALDAVSKEPTSTVARSSLIQYATAFIDQSNAVYDGLKSYQKTLNTQVSNMVSSINTLGNTIYNLNKQITKIESAGVESANDLRDARDNALDELSKYINISYYESDNGAVSVTAEGVPFVTSGGVCEMSTRTGDDSNLLIPTWPSFDRDVFDQTKLSTGDASKDKGSLKGLLAARGSVEVDYTDVPVRPSTSDYDMTTQEGQDAYQKAYDEYQEKQDYYNTYIEPSAILSAIAGLDKLVNGIVTAINDILCPETTMTTTSALTDSSGNELQASSYEYTSTSSVLYLKDGTEVEGTENEDGTYSYTSDQKLYTDEEANNSATVSSYTYTVLDIDNSGYGMDEDQTIGQELFSRENTDRYITSTDADGNTIYVRNNLNDRGADSDYTLGNLEMNEVVTQDKTKIPLSTLQGGEDIERAEQLTAIWSEDFASLNPEQYATSDFNTFYTNFIGEFATAGGVLNNYVSNETTMVNGYDNQRLQTSGVSSDEELTKMIRYQQAYNAASRYVNVVSQMLEHLVTSLGS